MSTQETKDAPQADVPTPEAPQAPAETPAAPELHAAVKRALRTAGEKFDELAPEAKARAVTFTEDSGLRGKALAAWIIDGKNLKQQVDDARLQREADEAGQQQQRRSQAAQNGGAARSRYPDDIREAVKIANEARGRSHGPGPKQHVLVREHLGDRDPLALVGLSALELRKVANGTGPKEDLAKLRDLSKQFDDPFCKGRNLAGILHAVVVQRAAAAKRKG